MIYRHMYFAYPAVETGVVKEALGCAVAAAGERGELFNACVGFYGELLYLYIETEREGFSPEGLLSAEVKRFPNGDGFKEMSDIFHYGKAIDRAQFKRGVADKRPRILVNDLHYHKVASYVYYHFQRQEEGNDCGDKYGIIFLCGNRIVIYLEEPEEVRTEPYNGILNTAFSPSTSQEWDELMTQHFIHPWIAADETVALLPLQ